MTKLDASQFDKPWLLLCEGAGDQRFFDSLIEARKIENDFCVRFPSIRGKYAGGRGSFGQYLGDIAVNESFISNVKGVLIVSDSDTDQAASFTEVQAEIRKANGYPIPKAEQTVAKVEGYPAVVILMIPIGESGNLESLCLKAAYAKWGLKRELDKFARKTPAGKWNEGKKAKMKVQTILAATNESQPDAGFGAHWSQPAKYLIPLDHRCFDGLVTFLSEFPEMIEA